MKFMASTHREFILQRLSSPTTGVSHKLEFISMLRKRTNLIAHDAEFIDSVVKLLVIIVPLFENVSVCFLFTFFVSNKCISDLVYHNYK